MVCRMSRDGNPCGVSEGMPALAVCASVGQACPGSLPLLLPRASQGAGTAGFSPATAAGGWCCAMQGSRLCSEAVAPDCRSTWMCAAMKSTLQTVAFPGFQLSGCLKHSLQRDAGDDCAALGAVSVLHCLHV